jgi:2,4-dienoyl-CoA reductase-like NADH-dependent reductase (Old Yellow Enzyme family)
LPGLLSAWADAARRAVDAGFDVIEIHAAHGYLLHEFMSPLSNLRTDEYGGDLTHRARLLFDVVRVVRGALPDGMPMLVRVSATEWVPDGLDVEAVAEVCRQLASLGVDFIDVSSGGNTPARQIPIGPGYQVPLARTIRDVSGLPVSAVGLITEPSQADEILANGSADAVMLARVLLREPSWPQPAAFELGDEIPWPPQYERGRHRRERSLGATLAGESIS